MPDMRDLSMLSPIESGRWFGRHYGLDPMHSTIANPFEICIEIMVNMTGCLPAVMGGVPLIRGSAAGGGAHLAYLNTQCAGGADAGTTTNGCFDNDAGVALIEYAGDFLDVPDYLMIWCPSLTTAPTNGSLLTQAAPSNATGIVRGSNLYEDWILIEDLHTGTWVTTSTFTDGGATMAPTPITPRTVDYRDIHADNLNYRAATALIPVGIRGYFETLTQGDVAGTGYNGAVDDKDSLTYNDNIAAYCKADYHDLAVAVPVNPDNVYAHAMETAAANANHTPEIITAYHRHNEPLIYTGDVGYNDQGVYEDPQL